MQGESADCRSQQGEVEVCHFARVWRVFSPQAFEDFSLDRAGLGDGGGPFFGVKGEFWVTSGARSCEAVDVEQEEDVAER